MPQVSVIVPVYKVEPYLRRCVDSILSQTFSDFELILVDDGSPDNCPAICEEYAASDKRVCVVHKENGGLSSARNAGLRIAQGRYIMFCDSDDYVSPRWCEAMLSLADDSKRSYIFGKMQQVSEDETNSLVENQPLNGDVAEFPVSAFLDLHTQTKVGFACNVLYYADVIRKSTLQFRYDVIIEDLPFCLEYMKKMDSVTYCAEAEYYYVQRNAPSLSRKYYSQGFRKWQEKYAAIQDFINEKIPEGERDAKKRLVAEHYLYYFLNSLENTFDERNTISLMQKLRYNQQVVRTKEFEHCLRYCAGRNENPRIISLLRNGNYYVVYFYICSAKAKNAILKKIRRNAQ